MTQDIGIQPTHLSCIYRSPPSPPFLPLFLLFVHPPFLLDCISEGERIYKCVEDVLIVSYLHGFVVCIVGKMPQDVGTATKKFF